MFREHMGEEQLGQFWGVDGVMGRNEMKRDCLVRWLTITNIAMCPSDARSCSIKSIEMDSHGHGGIGSCLRKPYGLCQFALECAHTVQDQMYCLTIWVSPSQ